MHLSYLGTLLLEGASNVGTFSRKSINYSALKVPSNVEASLDVFLAPLEGSEFPEVRNLKIRQKTHCSSCADVAERLPRHFSK